MDLKPITADLTTAYFELFDNAFGDNPHWAGCYCLFYDVTTPSEEWDPSDPGFGARNRAEREKRIERGEARGILAFEDGRPVGWVNAGPRTEFGNLRHFAEAVEEGDPPTGSIMCFVIHPDHRSRGVATSLLAGVDGYFRTLGLTQAEAYPRKEPPESPDFPWTAAYYKGTPSMYENAGYRIHREYEHFVAMRKHL